MTLKEATAALAGTSGRPTITHPTQDGADSQIVREWDISDLWCQLSPEEIGKLIKFAVWRARKLGSKAEGRDAYTLIADALIATAQGKRRWDPQKIGLFTHLRGTTRSIANGWFEKSSVELVCGSDGESDEGGHPPREPFTNINPERTLLAKELLSAIRCAFVQDPLALRVLDFLADRYPPNEIRARLCLSSKEYNAITKRIRRRLEVLFPGLQYSSARPACTRALRMTTFGASTAQAYVCRICGNKVVPAAARSGFGESHHVQWVCTGPCNSTFGPSWDPNNPSLATRLEGLRPWPADGRVLPDDEPSDESPIVADYLASVARRGIRPVPVR